MGGWVLRTRNSNRRAGSREELILGKAMAIARQERNVHDMGWCSLPPRRCIPRNSWPICLSEREREKESPKRDSKSGWNWKLLHNSIRGRRMCMAITLPFLMYSTSRTERERATNVYLSIYCIVVVVVHTHFFLYRKYRPF